LVINWRCPWSCSYIAYYYTFCLLILGPNHLPEWSIRLQSRWVKLVDFGISSICSSQSTFFSCSVIFSGRLSSLTLTLFIQCRMEELYWNILFTVFISANRVVINGGCLYLLDGLLLIPSTQHSLHTSLSPVSGSHLIWLFLPVSFTFPLILNVVNYYTISSGSNYS
jgi:hypothetical protein